MLEMRTPEVPCTNQVPHTNTFRSPCHGGECSAQCYLHPDSSPRRDSTGLQLGTVNQSPRRRHEPSPKCEGRLHRSVKSEHDRCDVFSKTSRHPVMSIHSRTCVELRGLSTILREAKQNAVQVYDAMALPGTTSCQTLQRPEGRRRERPSDTSICIITISSHNCQLTTNNTLLLDLHLLA